jgi:chaperonin cofactor prefoldin
MQGPPPIPCKPEAIKNLNSKKRQDELEQRHQELLARQRQLQEQYQRLQNMQQKANTIGPTSSIR